MNSDIVQRSVGAIGKDQDVQKNLEFYFQLCSLEVSCTIAATMAATLANGGVSPKGMYVCPLTPVHTCSKCFDSKIAQQCLLLMQTCGMNESSQQWNELVQLPGKCGVSGCVLLVVPRTLGLCVYVWLGIFLFNYE